MQNRNSFNLFFIVLLCMNWISTSALAMKTVLVTGGNRGIGLAIVQRLLVETSDVKVLMGSRDLSRGRKAAEHLNERLGDSCKDRLEVVELDTSSDDSVSRAAAEITSKHESLFGIINNAGVIGNQCINTNYFGPRRINDAFRKILKCPGGRIVNIASASGPNHVSSLSDMALKAKLSQPWKVEGGIAELDDLAESLMKTSDTYGTSKALLNVYTSLHARSEPDLIINSVTPGFIASDMGKSLGATKPTSFGAVPPVKLLLDEEFERIPTGRYYGSDMKRSPIDVYRGPGEPVYEGPDWK
jgi:NAD(P)-dependent dehydrogenase (short-subunit alcohol dehydrogenase family)